MNGSPRCNCRATHGPSNAPMKPTAVDRTSFRQPLSLECRRELENEAGCKNKANGCGLSSPTLVKNVRSSCGYGFEEAAASATGGAETTEIHALVLNFFEELRQKATK